MKSLDIQPIPNCFNIAIVISRFNLDITQRLLDGALHRLKELGFVSEQITIAWVAGAIEIPITAQRFAQTKQFEAIVCLGAVILGETRHFDYVCQQVSYGCQKVAIKHNIPVIFGVLTTETEEQALERSGGEKGHVGRSVIDTAYGLVSVLRQIDVL